MKTYTIIGGVNGVGKSSFTGVLAEYRNGELRTVGNHRPRWITELMNFLRG